MSRIRSFAAPHKGLRNAMSKFSLSLGYTNLNDPHELLALKQLGRDMFTLLNDHAATENSHTLRHLEERAPGSSQHDMEDHVRLEEIQAGLESRLSSFSGIESSDEVHAYYLDFSLFHSIYLEHIHEEETVTEQLLQEHFTDEELTHHRMAIMAKLPFPTLCLWLKYIVPGQGMTESIGMLSGLKQKASAADFQTVMTMIQSEMSNDKFESLIARLN